jgi:hypothetical protein
MIWARCPELELLQAKVKSHMGSSDPLSVMNSVIDDLAQLGAFSGPCDFDAYVEEYIQQGGLGSPGRLRQDKKGEVRIQGLRFDCLTLYFDWLTLFLVLFC